MLTMLVSAAGCSSHEMVSSTTSFTCILTVPSEQSLPGPYSGLGEKLWYGSNHLAVLIPENGVWPNHNQESQYLYGLFWLSDLYEGPVDPRPPLEVSGQKINGQLSALVASPTNYVVEPGKWLMRTIMRFPAPGCWQISGTYMGNELAFTTWVGAPIVE